jgi:hypothetical protein
MLLLYLTNVLPLLEGPLLPWIFVWQFKQALANILFLPEVAVPGNVSNLV